MPSPFPGMNPYLEQNDVWEDFHRRFLVFLAGDIESHVGPNYLVKIEARLYLRELAEQERRRLGSFGHRRPRDTRRGNGDHDRPAGSAP